MHDLIINQQVLKEKGTYLKTKQRNPQRPVKAATLHIRFRFDCSECKAEKVVETSSFKEAYKEIELLGWHNEPGMGWRCKKHAGETV